MKFLAPLALLALSACLDIPGQAAPPAAAPLRIASWNLEHLAARDGEGCRPRREADYAALRRHAAALGADAVAFQEVENRAAAERVFPPSHWRVVIEKRDASVQGGCRGLPGQTLRAQKVGFAVRRGVVFERQDDLAELGLGRRGLRSGVDIVIGKGRLRLLAVHLKSGCNSGRTATDRDCDTLFAQLPVLERWIDARAAEPVPFAVLGDWNRRLASRGDAFWTAIDDAEPLNADLTLAAGRQRATCKARYREFIDHIATDRRATDATVAGSFAEFTYGLPEAQHPSDHCPVTLSIAAAD